MNQNQLAEWKPPMKIELIADEYVKLDIVPRSTVCSIKPTLFSISDYCLILQIVAPTTYCNRHKRSSLSDQAWRKLVSTSNQLLFPIESDYFYLWIEVL